MAGEARDIKVQIKGVEKIYEGRNGKTVALNGVTWTSAKTSSSAWWGRRAAANPPC